MWTHGIPVRLSATSRRSLWPMSARHPRVLRMSSLFVRTLREDPADAEVPSHKLLVRAGYIRRAAPGIYTWLPLGLRVLRRIEAIVREEMDAMGGQEIQFPALLPREPYEATTRWTDLRMRPKARPMSLTDSPRFHRLQTSAFSAADMYGRRTRSMSPP